MPLSFDIPQLCADAVQAELQAMDPYINYGQDYIDSKIAEAKSAAIKAGENVTNAISSAQNAASSFADQLTGAAERVQTDMENRLGGASGLMSQLMKQDISGAASGLSSALQSKASSMVGEFLSDKVPSIPGVSLPTGLLNMPDFSSLKLC